MRTIIENLQVLSTLTGQCLVPVYKETRLSAHHGEIEDYKTLKVTHVAGRRIPLEGELVTALLVTSKGAYVKASKKGAYPLNFGVHVGTGIFYKTYNGRWKKVTKGMIAACEPHQKGWARYTEPQRKSIIAQWAEMGFDGLVSPYFVAAAIITTPSTEVLNKFIELHEKGDAQVNKLNSIFEKMEKPKGKAPLTQKRTTTTRTRTTRKKTTK